MMRIALIAILGVSAALAQDCDKGLWGDNCNNVCVGCKPADNGDIACDKTSGKCVGACAEGYRLNGDLCSPMCFGVEGAGGCENGGECVAPNYCICGKSGAQVVGVTGKFADKSGTLAEGTQCVSLRKDGIKGALISLVIMVISIGFCGFIEIQRNKGKSKKD